MNTERETQNLLALIHIWMETCKVDEDALRFSNKRDFIQSLISLYKYVERLENQNANHNR